MVVSSLIVLFFIQTDTFGKENMKCFINNFLRCDGVLLLKFITEHADARICRELTIELIKLYAQKVNQANSSIGRFGTSTPGLSVKPLDDVSLRKLRRKILWRSTLSERFHLSMDGRYNFSPFISWQTNFAIRNNRLRETGAPEQMYSGRSPANLPGYYESNIQRFNGVCKRNFAPAPAQMGAVQYNKCNGQKPTLDDVDRSETLPIAPKARGQSSGEQNSLQNGGTSIEKAQVHSSSTQDHESDASSSGMQYQQQPKPKDA
ncbi:unnamed protein product [Gongylonema pulchrum]|uniref:Rho-GAP domain-containing protein n=1 Tax=Gongylonema pulchrum TaxID=637853 RepID=A0A183D0E2_9BILA|nr:unnamed protein product [Gongylonema pulchrum]